MLYRFVDSFRAGADELSETCRFSCQNKFVKLERLVCFIIKKFVAMHGHVNVKSVGGVYLCSTTELFRQFSAAVIWAATQSYETKGKITALYIDVYLNFTFLDSKRRDTRLWDEW
jgi:hypothetical protein